MRLSAGLAAIAVLLAAGAHASATGRGAAPWLERAARAGRADVLTSKNRLLKIASARRERVFFYHFAACSATIDGISMELDFFSEHRGDGGTPTGGGLAVQNTGGILKTINRLTIRKDALGGSQIEMFAALDSDALFSEFTIPKSMKSEVRVFAKNFGKEWAVLHCVRNHEMD